MYKFLIALLVLPGFVFAQNNGSKAVAQANAGYSINGTLTGYEEGSSVSLVNANNGQAEATTQLTGGKFEFKGTLPTPDFKIISVNNQQPYLTLFLDNSEVTIKGDKASIDAATVTGSKSHNEFLAFNAVITPYEGMINGTEKVTDFTKFDAASNDLSKFITAHKESFITPLVIYRLNQFTGDNQQMETLFSGLTQPVKMSPIGSYIAQQIADNKKSPLGKPLANFTQNDTNDKPLSLASLKGKYVLVDFWASWCRPCRDENPNVVNMFNLYKDKNFTVLGVSLDKTKEPWIKAIADDNLNWAQVSDLKGWQNEVAAQFGITSIPQNYLIDPQGNIIGKNLRGLALQYKLYQIFK